MGYVPFFEAREQRASNRPIRDKDLNVLKLSKAAPIVDHQSSTTASEIMLYSSFEREFSTQLWCIECGAFPDPEFGDATYKDGASFFCLKCLKQA